jgi:hypothetical protein
MPAAVFVTDIAVLGEFRILVTFSDRALKEIDLADLIRSDDAFASVRDHPTVFEQVWVNPDTEAVEWPDEVSIGAEVLYGRTEHPSGARLGRRTLREPRPPEMNLVTPSLISAVPTPEDYVVHVHFEDGTEADIDLGYPRHLDGVFLPFRNPEFFRRLRVYDHANTIYWPNQSDIAPETLYAHALRSVELRGPAA